MTTPTVTIDMDAKCAECGKGGAAASGICLSCTHKAIGKGPLKSEEARNVRARFLASTPRKSALTDGESRRMEVRKVKYREGKVEITAEEPVGNLPENVKTITLKCSDEPAPSFVKAFAELTKHVRGILELKPEQWDEALAVSGVSFSMSEDGAEGATMTAMVSLDTANAPLVLNTPHLPYAQQSEKGNAPLMPEDAQEALEKVKKEAIAYLDGRRAQPDMFQEAAE